MKKQTSLILVLVFACNLVLAQTSKYSQFRMGIIQPDTAKIDASLTHFIDSVEDSYIQRYYSSVKRMEEMLEFTNYSEEMKESFEEGKRSLTEQLKYAKEAEQDVLNFKYYQLVSSYSSEIYNMFFNEYEPYSAIFEISNPKNLSFKDLADSLDLDYLIAYDDLRTIKTKGEIRMELISKLYSREKDEILINQNIKAGTESHGDMWTCLNPLTCLLINSIRNSVEMNFKEISKREKIK